MEKKNNLKIFLLFFANSKNIELQTLAYSFNLFLPTLILIIASFFKNYDLTAELAILIGFNIIFTQIFSSNAKSIIIAKKSIKILVNYIFFRLLIAIIIILSNLIFFNLFEFTNNLILLLISLIIVLQWQIELILIYFEMNNKINQFYYYIIFALIFIFLIIINFIFHHNLFYTLSLYNIFLFIFYLVYFNKVKKLTKGKIILKNIFISSLKSKAFISSFSISFANLIWRFLLIHFCGKILAGIYFASFAIGSLPGTMFNSTFGPSLIKNNIKFNKKSNIIIYIFILILLFLLLFNFYNKNYIFINPVYTQIFCIFLSLIGSVFMVKGLYFRQYLIQKTSYASIVFIIDIFYSILIISIVPLLYLVGGQKMLITSFLLASIISYITYKISKILLTAKI